MAQMLNSAAIDKAARFLVEARRARRLMEAIPEDCRPQGFDDAVAIHEAVARLLGAKTVGWKAGFSSPKQMNELGIDAPLGGRLLESAVVTSPAVLPAQRYHAALWETEIACRIGKTLGPRAAPFTRADVLAAIASVHIAMEVPDFRFASGLKVGLPSIIADSFASEALVVGGEIANWRNVELTRLPIELVVDGKIAATGAAPEQRPDPLATLHGFANALRARNLALEAGQVVTTGLITAFVAAKPGERAIGRIPGGAEVVVTLQP